ncbi:hypothetical protein OGV25_23395 [Pseudomonas sp. P1B16]|jgi:hypothetical protein|uniref:hypothetical protein n=1 Tax=Pseudomonas TaxID=286 RepID=UPI000BA305B3|nr:MULTISPECIES: hypothetical protein [unclassified Pseudomonas]MBC3479062.1 hypothetical protein [Pseudomonas sp. SWRI77]MBC3504299.1 hypothetical protein [Pseudomonas sp. SWRI59]MBC3509610.1 hypothetical protein [Pseudomonas sp. SWRI68]MDD2062043.1 hypothetical protein [Pseudomonas sp. 25571]UDU80699.1 hypothetical protein LJX93_23430 [Pseudomonas sp. HN2-3]
MPSAQDFQSFTASVFPSQAAEIVIDKQPVLADYGRELRSAINQLPPEATRTLLSEYGGATAQVVTSIEDAILLREFAHERAAQQADLSQEWLNAADRHGPGINEAAVAADDTWNMAP